MSTKVTKNHDRAAAAGGRAVSNGGEDGPDCANSRRARRPMRSYGSRSQKGVLEDSYIL